MTDSPYKSWRFCAWGGPLFLVTYIFFWGILGFNIPPLSPALTSAELAAHFIEHANRLRVAYVVALLVASFYLLWTVSIFKIMERMEGDNKVLSYIGLLGGGATVVWVTLPNALWLTAAFRPETDPAILQMLYDLGWLILDCTYAVSVMQMVSLAVLFLNDRREVTIFPKWLGWYNIWTCFIFLTLIIMPYFRVGLWAWDGWMNFWVAFFAWFIWIVAQSYFVFRAIARFEQEDGLAKRPSPRGILKPGIAVELGK